MGRHLEIEWAESEQELKELIRDERDAERYKRLLAFALLRKEYTIAHVSEIIGVCERTVGLWCRFYREGGLQDALSRTIGAQATGVGPKLTPEQEKIVLGEIDKHRFHSKKQILLFIEEKFGVSFNSDYFNIWLRKRKVRLLVPRPVHHKTSLKEQRAWKKKLM
jgi:transposase